MFRKISIFLFAFSFCVYADTTIDEPHAIDTLHYIYTGDMSSDTFLQYLWLRALGFNKVINSTSTNTIPAAIANLTINLNDSYNAEQLSLFTRNSLNSAFSFYNINDYLSTNSFSFASTSGVVRTYNMKSSLPLYYKNFLAPYAIYGDLHSMRFGYYTPEQLSILDSYGIPAFSLPGFGGYFGSEVLDEQTNLVYTLQDLINKHYVPSLLNNLFGNLNGPLDDMGLPVGEGFVDSAFMKAYSNNVQSVVGSPLQEIAHFQAHFNTNSVKRIGEGITNIVRRLDDTNNILQNGNDSIQSRVIHIDEDLHTMLQRLSEINESIQNLQAGGGGGSGGGDSSGGTSSNGFLNANLFWNVDWSNVVFGASSNFPSDHDDIINYAKNWWQGNNLTDIFNTSTPEPSLRMIQLLSLIYTQNAQLYRMSSDLGFIVGLSQTNITKIASVGRDIGVLKSAQNNEEMLSEMMDSAEKNTAAGEYERNTFIESNSDFSSKFSDILSSTNKIAEIFQGAIHAFNVSPRIENQSLTFFSADGRSYNLSINFTDSKFAEFSEKSRKFVDFSTYIITFISLIFFVRSSIVSSQRFFNQ